MRADKITKPSLRRPRRSSPSNSTPNGALPSAPAFSAPAQNGAAPALTRDDILQSLNHQITSAAPRIVHKILEHAEEHASYLHAKFLFDFAGLHAAPAPVTNSAEHSLAALLLRALEIPAQLSTAPAEHPDAPAHPNAL